ncbi:MAG: DUF192 domain-containing protein [Patescibacteria group bacterium]
MLKSIFLPIIAVAVFISFVGFLSQGKFDSLFKKITPTPTSSYKTIKIESTEIQIEVAKTNDERAKGLSNRTKLDEKAGMIFVFEKKSKPVFWMKDTKIPLDIIWISNNKIVRIDKNVEPEPNVIDSKLTKYPAPSEIDYVLEVNGGFSDKFGIKLGQSLSGLEQL